MKTLLALTCLVPSILMAQRNGLTLAEVRTKVLAGNPSVRESLQRITAAEAVVKQANSAYLPTITLSGNVGHVSSSLHPDSDMDNRHADSFRQAKGGLQGTWLLFDGFAREARALGARYGLQQSQELAAETRRLLILSATVSFREAQLAKQSVEIAEQDYAFNTNLKDDARKRFKAGILPEADVHNFSIRALLAEISSLQAKHDFGTACTVLAELMALPEAQLPGSMRPVGIKFEAPALVPPIQGELQYALRHRPDYRAIESGLLALEQQVRVAKGSMLPQIALVGEINYTDRDGVSTVDRHGNYDSLVGVTASWDLFTGGRKKATVKQAQAEMRALAEQKGALRLYIRSSLRQRIDEAETTRAVFQRQERIYALTVSVRDSVEKSYKAGAASITRLNEAQTDLVQARGGYSSSCIAYQLVLNLLDIDTGRILGETGLAR